MVSQSVSPFNWHHRTSPVLSSTCFLFPGEGALLTFWIIFYLQGRRTWWIFKETAFQGCGGKQDAMAATEGRTETWSWSGLWVICTQECIQAFLSSIISHENSNVSTPFIPQELRLKHGGIACRIAGRLNKKCIPWFLLPCHEDYL